MTSFATTKKRLDKGEMEAYQTTIDHILLVVQSVQELVSKGGDKNEIIRKCNIKHKTYLKYEKIASSKHLQELARAGQLTNAIVDGLSKEEDDTNNWQRMVAIFRSKHLQNLARNGQLTHEIVDKHISMNMMESEKLL